ncbi:MAG TPA: hypothetical protein VFO31_17145 [Vicinamibacterales bacterium]|nr:hypothetical protein [Vicinamibacterales bacterium]
MAFFEWLETLSFSSWVRESGSLWAFPMFLFSHTLGMAMVAGGSTLQSFAFLGLWPKRTPIKPLEKIYPIMWLGFWVNLFTGVGLFCADATTRAINPDFWVKLVFVAVGVFAMVRMRKVFASPALDNGPVPSQAKTLAWVSLICWFGAICAGRLIAYVGPVAGV